MLTRVTCVNTFGPVRAIYITIAILTLERFAMVCLELVVPGNLTFNIIKTTHKMISSSSEDDELLIVIAVPGGPGWMVGRRVILKAYGGKC